MVRKDDIDFYKFSKFDLILVILVLFFSGFLIFQTVYNRVRQSAQAGRAVIYQDGKLTGQWRLDKDRNLELLGSRMQIEIRNNRVRVAKSDCFQHICMNMGWVRYSGQTIVCVPNKVIIELKSAAEPFLDAVAN